MRFDRLSLRDFRNYSELDLELAKGTNLFVGANGAGKTSLLEAVSYLATMASFRSSSIEPMIRNGAETSEAVIRGEAKAANRELLLEVSLQIAGKSKFQLNRQKVKRRRDLLGHVLISVFSPDDLALVKGSPDKRRRFLDDGLVQTDPRFDSVRSSVESVLRQRNALLRQSGGRPTTDVLTTLDVWDIKFSEVGEELGQARSDLTDRLAPQVEAAYQEIAGDLAPVSLRYQSDWLADGLSSELDRVRNDDLKRGTTTVGPHRDDLIMELDGRPARIYGSQGEQRSLALALRLALHREMTAIASESPLLLLDDVFSELAMDRSRRVLTALDSEQTLLTTAGPVPEEIVPSARFRVAEGRVVREQ